MCFILIIILDEKNLDCILPSICCVLTSHICLVVRQMLYMDITVFTPLTLKMYQLGF